MTNQPDASGMKPKDDTPSDDKKKAEEENEEEEIKPDNVFISFANCKSRDGENPDIIKVIAVDYGRTFETELSTCAYVKDMEGKLRKLPLKYHNSSNPGLLPLWDIAVKKGKIKPDKKVTIKTWLIKTKKGRDFREFTLVV